jgi:hypothetical protein
MDCLLRTQQSRKDMRNLQAKVHGFLHLCNSCKLNRCSTAASLCMAMDTRRLCRYAMHCSAEVLFARIVHLHTQIVCCPVHHLHVDLLFVLYRSARRYLWCSATSTPYLQPISFRKPPCYSSAIPFGLYYTPDLYIIPLGSVRRHGCSLHVATVGGIDTPLDRSATPGAPS